MNKKTTDNDEDDEGGEDGSTGGGAGLMPSYHEIFETTNDEKELTELAAQAVFEQRISLKGKGYEVSALDKIQQLRNKLLNPNADVGPEQSGLGLEEHPDLTELGGEVDPSTVVLPESEELAAASNDPQLQLKLRDRLAAKFGMGSGVSLQTLQEAYRKEMEKKSRPRPEHPEPEPPTPRYYNVPRPRPNR